MKIKTTLKLGLLALLVLNFGCISYTKVPLTDCDHPSGWCLEIRNIAVKSWKYGQLSKNVYNKPYQFDMKHHFEKIKDYEKNQIDFFATLYRDISNDELVLVYRGTDSFKDFKTGNNPFKQSQNNYGVEIFDLITKEYGQISVVSGHSLGGGIAIHLSLNRENIVAFSFNGSPVFKNIKNITNDRYSIVENGEVLKAVRLIGREANQLYTSIGCADGNAITQHDMQSLATCLTQIAAIEDKEARKSLALNNIEFEY
jgi:hypothetical protein